MSRITKLRTLARLGLASLLRVGSYRLRMRLGIHPVQKLAVAVPEGPFLRAPERHAPCPLPNTDWDETIWRFGWHSEPRPPGPPNWFANPFAPGSLPDASCNWWELKDFDDGDIKGVWELSRFDWVIAWATQAAAGDDRALARLNDWLTDWSRQNAAYRGPNWKCGQESSIRVMHLAVAAWILKQDATPEPGLVALLDAHLRRIAPTMSYAIGQQNNHGTSEAAALFIGGSLLIGHVATAEDWAAKGLQWLENRARVLIEPDGSFSQHSVTYHRVMLDTYALAEAWRRHRGLPPFSDRLHTRLASATGWLHAMTDPKTGDAPNLGANDGARLLPLTGTDYRDFRPSVQLASALFLGTDAFGSGPWTAPLRWFDVPEGQPAAPAANASFDYGGFHVLHKQEAMAVLRYPRFRFRPSQADALHLDLWHEGLNLLRDAGTYSYNAEGSEWFSGTAAHNTIEFDGRDQMPRLGRFLFGDWLKAENVEPVSDDGVSVRAAAAYTDAIGARHHRAITLNADGLTCQDTITGNFEAACLRWRLAPGEWHVESNIVRNGTYSIAIEIDGVPIAPAFSTTVESRYYQQKTEIPEVSVKVNRPGTLVTKVAF